MDDEFNDVVLVEDSRRRCSYRGTGPPPPRLPTATMLVPQPPRSNRLCDDWTCPKKNLMCRAVARSLFSVPQFPCLCACGLCLCATDASSRLSSQQFFSVVQGEKKSRI
ncbi:unnamed protein product [Trichogramma brassicae]|uniref:Uncharacterized protein n=1 Tax=Trichogramma brassicae TaxID=86971 RepID=A0A6H5HU86_9HYME|nr:unnamed protein product [Trichogramma brassicae]